MWAELTYGALNFAWWIVVLILAVTLYNLYGLLNKFRKAVVRRWELEGAKYNIQLTEEDLFHECARLVVNQMGAPVMRKYFMAKNHDGTYSELADLIPLVGDEEDDDMLDIPVSYLGPKGEHPNPNVALGYRAGTRASAFKSRPLESLPTHVPRGVDKETVGGSARFPHLRPRHGLLTHDTAYDNGIGAPYDGEHDGPVLNHKKYPRPILTDSGAVMWDAQELFSTHTRQILYG